MNNNLFQKELENIVASKPTSEIFEFMEQNIESIFSTPDIPIYYRTLKNTDFTLSKRTMPKLMMAWMAFLSGEHAGLFLIMNHIHEAELEGPQESSMFYALKAFTCSMMNLNEGLKYAKLSIDVLPQEEKSLYMANAKLTYGQLLSGNDQYRLAAEMFSSSREVFHSLNLHFLSMIAMVNEVLNRYRLGEITYVINKCNEALLMSSSFKEEVQTYWNIVHLPLGMCYYELNKPNLAVEHLKLAKASIDQSDLFHMHGLIELYLFKSYYILNDGSSMDQMKRETVDKFKHMHYKQMDLLISMFNILSSGSAADDQMQADIEKFELEYSNGCLDGHSVVTDVLVFLKLKGFSDMIDADHLEKNLERLKYIGNIPRLQLTLLQLAELNLLENRQTQAVNYLKEAVQIYKKFGICASFYSLPLKSVELLKAIDVRLYHKLTKNNRSISTQQTGTLLSEREKDIMKLIALGKTNEEMSKSLFISVGTIKWHINNIFGKLEVKNRVQAIEKAKSLGEIV